MSKPRVLITTDLGGNDKDDAQSLIHALLYADELDYRGVVSTLTDQSRASGGRDFDRIVDAYENDLSALSRHGDYPSAEKIRGLWELGSQDPSWPGNLSDGARLIIEEARASSPADPLYVLGWGPIHDIARALQEAPDIVDNVRVISIAGHRQDVAHPEAFNWMREAVSKDADYNDLWWVDSAESFRGMYIGADGQNDPSLNLGWGKQNADGHGALGDLFHDVYSFDLHNNPNYRVDGTKMGDTPSLLYLVDEVSDDNPSASSWGGSYQKNGLGPNTWSDKGGERMGPYDGARTVFEHRDEAWGDFAARLDRLKASSAPPDPVPEPLPEPGNPPVPDLGMSFDGASIGFGRTEIETLDLSGYAYESRGVSSDGANTKTNGRGSASGTFEGPSGTHEITVGYLDENDGVANWTLVVDGKAVTSWSGNANSHGEETISVELALETGDEIAIEGRRSGGEHARLDWLEIAPAAGGQVTPPPVGGGGPTQKDPAPDKEPGPAKDPGPAQEAIDADLFVFAGQSNAAGHFFRRGGDSSGGSLGNQVFERAIEAWSGEDARVVNTAVSGSGSNQYADRANYWWNVDADKPGPLLVRAVKTMQQAEASGRDVDGFIWAQGEDDARVVRDNGSNLGVTMQRFDESTRAVFDHVRDALGDPDLPIFVQELGNFRQDGGWLDGPVGALDAMRNVQSDVIRGMSDVHLGARTRDVDAHHDAIHFSNAGYGTIADRLADSVTEVISDEFMF